jgi:hypothetical protein
LAFSLLGHESRGRGVGISTESLWLAPRRDHRFGKS